MKHYEQYKKRKIAEIDENLENDAALKYYKRCLETNTLPLPIFEKIFKKTLCLYDYILSEGQCQGIADACDLIDHKYMNRVLLSNCGISGDNFATILEGLIKVKDFKSVIYKHNELNSRSIEKLGPLFWRRVPHHLTELHIIDCKIHPVALEELFDLMLGPCFVQNFALVNAHHTEGSFSKLCQYVKTSPRLVELNVSW